MNLAGFLSTLRVLAAFFAGGMNCGRGVAAVEARAAAIAMVGKRRFSTVSGLRCGAAHPGERRGTHRRIALSAFILLILSAPVGAAVEMFVSVLPLAFLAEGVGGDRVHVEALVQPGYSPHAYEPGPRQMARLARADLFVRVGVPYEAGLLERIRATNPELRFVDAREGLPLLPLPAHGHDDHDHGNDPDPHVWTDPLLAIRIAAGLRDVLSAVDPEGAAQYAANFARLRSELAALDEEARSRLSGLSKSTFLVFHPAWGYFAAAYGLRQLAIERLGKDPGPRELGEIIDHARSEGVQLILVQRQNSRQAADAVAEALGIPVRVVDPLSKDYPAALRHLVDILGAALK